MIKKIRDNENFDHRHLSDVKRIQEVLMKNGYDADLPSCAEIWEEHSDSYAAGWLGLPSDDNEIWGVIEYEVKNKCK